MKFAFTTTSAPKWDFPALISRAKEYGYDGVEIRGFLTETILTAANPFHSDSDKLRGMFQTGGVEIACLSSSIAYHHNKRRDANSAVEMRTFIDLAQRLGCPLVKIFDTQIKAGQSRSSAGITFGDWLLPLGDYAAEHDVTIVVENALSFRTSKELWMMMDRISHPAIAVCWDVFNAAIIGESPYVSVPTLNSRIAYTQVKDALLGPLGANYCKLGEGDVPVQKFLIRLMGIGYDGYVTMEWEKAWLPGLAEPEEILPDAITKLREWTKPQLEEEEAPKATHAKATSDAAPAAAP